MELGLTSVGGGLLSPAGESASVKGSCTMLVSFTSGESLDSIVVISDPPSAVLVDGSGIVGVSKGGVFTSAGACKEAVASGPEISGSPVDARP